VNPATRILILSYHTVTDAPEPGMAPWAVRPGDFARHLDLIVGRRCTALTVSGLVGLLDQGVTVPPGTVVITFDDGFEDNLTVAAPMLADRGLPATVYVPQAAPEGKTRRIEAAGARLVLPWDGLAELEAAGVEVGSHSHSHPELDVLPKAEARWEIQCSRALLEQELGHPVPSFAYPHGYATRWLQEEVRRSGFRSACGVRNAFSHARDNRWLLARVTVGASTTSAQFDRLLARAGASTAPAHERLRTKAWRAARRAPASAAWRSPRRGQAKRRRVTSNGRPAAARDRTGSAWAASYSVARWRVKRNRSPRAT